MEITKTAGGRTSQLGQQSSSGCHRQPFITTVSGFFEWEDVDVDADTDFFLGTGGLYFLKRHDACCASSQGHYHGSGVG